MKKKNQYNEIVAVLNRLHKSHPSYTFGQHIDTALSDYTDIWGITDKEFLFALEKYESELELDHHSDLNIDKIIKDGKELNMDTEEEYFDDY